MGARRWPQAYHAVASKEFGKGARLGLARLVPAYLQNFSQNLRGARRTNLVRKHALCDQGQRIVFISRGRGARNSPISKPTLRKLLNSNERQGEVLRRTTLFGRTTDNTPRVAPRVGVGPAEWTGRQTIA